MPTVRIDYGRGNDNLPSFSCPWTHRDHQFVSARVYEMRAHMMQEKSETPKSQCWSDSSSTSTVLQANICSTSISSPSRWDTCDSEIVATVHILLMAGAGYFVFAGLRDPIPRASRSPTFSGNSVAERTSSGSSRPSSIKRCPTLM